MSTGTSGAWQKVLRGASDAVHRRRMEDVTSAEYMILVVNRDPEPARNLKELIQFMDTPHVRVTRPECWRETLGDYRLQALFVGPDVGDREIEALIADVGALDPNASIVMLNEGEAT